MTNFASPHPYPHWMLREIYEQPATLAATLERYIDGEGFRAETCGPVLAWLERVQHKIVIAASGSSRHAGLVAELLIEDLSGVAVDVEYASEYCYRAERSLPNAAVVVISQSGETVDTLAALRKAKLAGHETLAITNVDDSTMEREATAAFPTVAGRERAIPATKSFTAQLLNLYLLSLMKARFLETITDGELKARLAEVAGLPAKIEAQLKGWEEAMRGGRGPALRGDELSVSGARRALCDRSRGRAEVEGVGVSACRGVSERRVEAWSECAGGGGHAAGDGGDGGPRGCGVGAAL